METKQKRGAFIFRYIAAVLAFAAILIVAPALISFLQMLFDLITPAYFRSGKDWALILGHIVAPFLAFSAVSAIIGRVSIFPSILQFVGGAYLAFVAGWNYLLGITDGFTAFATAIGAAFYIGIGVWGAVNYGRAKERDENNGKESNVGAHPVADSERRERED